MQMSGRVFRLWLVFIVDYFSVPSEARGVVAYSYKRQMIVDSKSNEKDKTT